MPFGWSIFPLGKWNQLKSPTGLYNVLVMQVMCIFPISHARPKDWALNWIYTDDKWFNRKGKRWSQRPQGTLNTPVKKKTRLNRHVNHPLSVHSASSHLVCFVLLSKDFFDSFVFDVPSLQWSLLFLPHHWLPSSQSDVFMLAMMFIYIWLLHRLIPSKFQSKDTLNRHETKGT